MSNITEFLLARIAEDEQAAQVRTVSHRMIGGKMVDIPRTRRRLGLSPERVLAECAASGRSSPSAADHGPANMGDHALR